MISRRTFLEKSLKSFPLLIAVGSPAISANEKRRAQNCPVGEGEVDFDAYFALHKELGLSGPLSLHYPWLNSKEMAKLNHKERKKQTINIMQQTSLNTVNRYLKKYRLD